MKKNYVFLLGLLLSVCANSQVQFVSSFNSAPNGGGSVFTIRSSGVINIAHEFPVTDILNNKPFPLTEGPDGRIYGLSSEGGANRRGGIYVLNSDGSGFTNLYSCAADANVAETKPAFGPDGKLYVIISGKLCSMNLDGTEFSTLVAVPTSYSLQIDADGWVYGIGTNAGQNFVYKVKTDGSGYIILHTLVPDTDGNGIAKGLVLTPTGRLFGANRDRGPGMGGTLFSIQTDGTGFTIHKAFEAATVGDGYNPACELIYKDGKVWGTTRRGGSGALGVIFTYDIASADYNVVYNSTFGMNGGVIFGTDGTLYCLSSSLHAEIYRLDPDGQNVQRMYSSLALTGGGYLTSNQSLTYHTSTNSIITVSTPHTYYGRNMVIRVGTVENGFYSRILHQFGSATGGSRPGAIIKDGLNKLYGITYSGGTYEGGTLYSLNYDGNGYAKLYDFNQSQTPIGKMLLASDKKLYGIYADVIQASLSYHVNGSYLGPGGIFRINTDGSGFEIIKQFTSEGAITESHLVEAPDGTLYGLMDSKVSDGACIYRIQKDGSGFGILKNFSFSEGKRPMDGLILKDDFLYGTCSEGGSGSGTIFRIGSDGTGFEVLRDGSAPYCGLTAGSDGKLYGVNSHGGVNSAGTIFSMNPDGSAYTVLHYFEIAASGFLVRASLTEGSDGKLYGTTTASGPSNLGSFFSLNRDGSDFNVLKVFDAATGRMTLDELVEIPLASLPVKLNYFTARQKNETVELQWATSEEENSEKYIVERSTDGANYADVAIVQASGNTSSLMTYSALDHQPFKGKNYYRLKIVDRDRSYNYSPVQAVDLTKKTNGFRIFPNPSQRRILIEGSFTGNSLSISVMDLSGKIIRRVKMANSTVIDLDISGLAEGVYTLVVEDTVTSKSSLFIKAR